MKCPNCHSHLNKKANFCSNCGGNISQIKKDKKNKKNIKWVLIILIPTAMIFTVLVFLYIQDANYDSIIDNGIEAISDKDYDKAITYFEIALDEKKEDETAEILSRNTVFLQDAEKLYVNEEFNQSLEKIDLILSTKNKEDKLELLFDQANKLKSNIKKLKVDSTKFQIDFEKAEEILFQPSVSSTEIEQSLNILNDILSHNEINKKYHSEMKQKTEKLARTLDDQQKQFEEIEKEENDDSSEYSTEKTNEELSKYSMEEVEYARVILSLDGPGSPKVHVNKELAGTPVAQSFETNENTEFPDETIVLIGESATDNVVIYSPLDNGNINLYLIPFHWRNAGNNPENLSIEEFQESAQEVLDSAIEVFNESDDDKVLEILKRIEFIY